MSNPVSQPVASSTSAAPARIAAKSDNNLVWVDMEMTGLSPENDRICLLYTSDAADERG